MSDYLEKHFTGIPIYISKRVGLRHVHYKSDYLMSKCFDRIIENHDALCRDANCDEAVKISPMGRWYITMGHAGFNTNANNGNGYATKDSALNAMRRYLNS